MFRNVYLETYKSSLLGNVKLQLVMTHLGQMYNALGCIMQDVQYLVGLHLANNNRNQQNTTNNANHNQKRREKKQPFNNVMLPSMDHHLGSYEQEANQLQKQLQNGKGYNYDRYKQENFIKRVKKPAVKIIETKNSEKLSKQMENIRNSKTNNSNQQQKNIIEIENKQNSRQGEYNSKINHRSNKQKIRQEMQIDEESRSFEDLFMKQSGEKQKIDHNYIKGEYFQKSMQSEQDFLDTLFKKKNQNVDIKDQQLNNCNNNCSLQ